MPKTSISFIETNIPSRIAVSAGGEIAVVISAQRGRTDKVYTIENVEDFDTIFGSGNGDAFKYCKFLLNRGNILKVVRTGVGGSPTAKAFANLYQDGAVTGTSYLKVEAVTAGEGYNGISVRLTNLTDGVFSLDIGKRSVEGFKAIESYGRVSLDSDSLYYIGNIESELVTFTLEGLTPSDTLFPSDAAGTVVEAELEGGVGTADTTNRAFNSALEYLKSKNVQFTTLIIPEKTVGDWFGSGTVGVDTLIDHRKDFLALPEFPEDAAYDVLTGLVNSIINGYTAIYYPRVKTSVLGNKTPVSVLIADIIANLHKRNLQYKAPAGTTYGIIEEAFDVVDDLSEAQVAELQEAGINPVISMTGFGTVIWGQDLLASPAATVDLVAVRALSNYFKRNIYSISQAYMFRENNQFTWNDWVNEVTPLFRGFSNAGGILQYKVECGVTTMTNAEIQAGIMRGKVAFQPVGYITTIEILYTIDETGVTFTEE